MMNCPMTVTHHLRTHLVSLPRVINMAPAHGVDHEKDRTEIEVDRGHVTVENESEVDLVSENEDIGRRVAIVVSVIRVGLKLYFIVRLSCTHTVHWSRYATHLLTCIIVYQACPHSVHICF